jgi:hypothetical protein
MAMQQKSSNRSKKKPNVIVIKLNEEQKRKIRESLSQQDLTKFKIDEIEVKVIPMVRLKNHIFVP